MNTPGGAGYCPALGYLDFAEKAGSASAAFAGVLDPPSSNLATAKQNFGQTPTATPALLTSPSSGILHITKAEYTVTGAADLVSLLTPLNFTTLAADGVATTTTSASITLTNDPGLYATKYRPLAANAPTFPNAPALANNAIAANDWIAYQAADGTWVADLVAGVAGSTTITVGLTNGMPIVKSGSLVYFFGVAADKDPATGRKRPQVTPAASSAHASWSDAQGCICSTRFDGDPILVLGKNTDNTLVIHSVSGFASGK